MAKIPPNTHQYSYYMDNELWERLLAQSIREEKPVVEVLRRYTDVGLRIDAGEYVIRKVLREVEPQ